jgi:exopolysaccharide biosynthesis protein
MTEYASQTILWAIDNGRVNESLLKKAHAKLERHRTIMGENDQGQIMIISSSSYLSLVTIEEIINFAIEKGMVEAILLDGGTSVDYKCTNGVESVDFSSVPENLKPTFGITKPFTYIFGNLN